MQLYIRRLTCLAVLVAMVATTASQNMKLNSCCTRVGTGVITAPIIGYRIQKKILPCVRAVIFETTEGDVCSHWKQDWVFEKIKEIAKAQRANRTTAATTTSSA